MPDPLFPSPRDGAGEGVDDGAEQALRRVLAAQASAVDPGEPPRVGDLADRRVPRRWPTALAVAAAVAVLAVTSAVVLRPDAADVPVAGPAASPTAQPSTEPTAALSDPPATLTSEPTEGPASAAPVEPTSEPSGTAGPGPGTTTGPTSRPSPSDPLPVVVWGCTWPEPNAPDVLLSPERRTGERPTGDDMSADELAVAAALRVLFEQEALDPDYVNPWASVADNYPRMDSIEVDVTNDGTVVDFSRAPAGLSTGHTFGCLVQSLVRTVVSNGGTAPVRYLVDGRPEPFIELDMTGPETPRGDLLAGGWILDPHEGQRLPSGTVTLSGTATAFEATVAWQVLDADGSVVDQGFTMAGSNGEYGPWSVPLELAPGTYTAVLWADDMAGTENSHAGRLWEDTKTFTVLP